MDHSDFVEANGTVWHIFAGVPVGFPDSDTGNTSTGARAGLTFRSENGEVRVLPLAAIPRRVQIPAPITTPLGATIPVSRVSIPEWNELLRAALLWSQE